MNTTVVDRFLAQASAATAGAPGTHRAPADCVLALAPLMLGLVEQAASFLEPRHLREETGHYARHLVQATPDGSLSLYALVWSPGQWTPVHDHGTWGVVGIVEGVLEEREYVRVAAGCDDDEEAGDGVQLARGGVLLLGRGAVASFVPSPDHIHVTGVPDGRPRAVSLHLYGRTMDGYNTYEVETCTRRRVEVALDDR